jgi:hypothetical protein
VFPGINIYGNEPKNFPVPTGLNIGVQVTVQTPQEIAGDAPIQTLPLYIQAAGTLNIELSGALSPPQENHKLVNPRKGRFASGTDRRRPEAIARETK